LVFVRNEKNEKGDTHLSEAKGIRKKKTAQPRKVGGSADGQWAKQRGEKGGCREGKLEKKKRGSAGQGDSCSGAVGQDGREMGNTN